VDVLPGYLEELELGLPEVHQLEKGVGEVLDVFQKDLLLDQAQYLLQEQP
jgi:hypothetical protein